MTETMTFHTYICYNCLLLVAFCISFTLQIDPSIKHREFQIPPKISAQPEPNPFAPENRKGDRVLIYYKAKELRRIGCTATGKPQPSFMWKKDGQPLDIVPGKNSKITMEQGVGTLIFLNMTETDAGVYQCVATNARGAALSLKAELIFSVHPTFSTVIQPKLVTSFYGNSATLKCQPPLSIPKSNVFWTNSSGDIFSRVVMSKRVMLDYTGSLHFANVIKKDENQGKSYICNTYHEIMRSINQGEDTRLEVKGSEMMKKPVNELWKSNTDVLGLTGETVKFMCIFSGNPTPTIKWKRLGKAMDVSRMNVSSTGHELVITNVKQSDASQYQCEGSNEVTIPGNIRRITFTLRVEAKPSWTLPPTDQTVGINENAEFRCKAVGTPEPTVEWFINGKRIADVMNERRSLNANTGVLKFTGVTKEDSQVIQCLATNKHGSLWANMYLNVIALVPQIKPLPEDTKVAIGYSKTLTCNNNGKPTPQLAWYKGEQEQPLSGSRYTFTQDSITILNVTDYDEGTYRCTAKNSEGDVSAQSKLYVRAKTSILTGPRSKKIRHGVTVKFQCAAVTDPQEQQHLTVKWMKRVGDMEEPVDLSDPAISVNDENELTITSTSSKHSGRYICVASNNIDSDKRAARLRVEAPPDPPVNAKVPYCPGDSATITWEAGSNNFFPIKHYIINFKTSFDIEPIWRFLLQTNNNATTVTTKLSPWVNYTFQVIAENDLGKSDPSDDAQPVCTTSPQIPDKHPSGVKTLDDTTGYLVVTWDRMEKMEHNGPNFHYVVLVRKKNGGVFQPYTITDWDDTRKEIPVDNIYEEYEIVVKAKNARGEPLADSTTFIGFSGQAEPLVVPQNFEHVTKDFSYKTATFQWDRVDEDNVDLIRGRFRGYEIRYWKKDNPDKVKGILIDQSHIGRTKRAVPKKATAVVSNLPPFSDLQLDVVVRNDHFTSNGSNVIDLTTPQGVPGPVENLRALGRSAVHITLRWEKPIISNGIIIRYDIGFEKVEGLDISPDIRMDRSVNVDPDSTQTRFNDFIDGLEPRTGYRIHVWAVTEAGKGKDMFIDVKTMAPGVPDAPIIDEVLASKHSINVSWSMRSESNNAYIYYVEYRRRIDSNFIPSGKTEVLKNWQVIDNLTSDTMYEVVVVASAHSDINAGQTARSEVRSVRTMGKAVEIASAGPFFGAPWFIILMVLLALLILIIIIVCLVKRSRGDKYHVQEKEKLRGLDPEDRKAAHFNEFNDKKKKAIGRPYNLQTSFSGETQPLAGSPDEAEKGPLESDKDSLEEYGDVDPSRFNEDGSFIGQYGAQNTTASDIAPPTSAMHTFV